MLQINASIVKHKGKVWCAYRTQHLFKYDAKCYISELNEEFDPILNKRLKAENNNTAFEDVRLFSFGDSLLAFYTYFPQISETDWLWQFGVGFGVVDLENFLITNQCSLRHLSKREHEKNWSPYVHDGELFILTDYDPYIRVLKLGFLDTPAKEIYISPKRTLGWKYGELRGGTPLLPNPNNDNGWHYGFIHSYLPQSHGFNRYYYYTAVRFSHERKEIEYYPEPLQYQDENPDEEYEMLWRKSNNRTIKVIFPIGIMHYEDGLMVSFGKDDVMSFTQHFKWDFIESLFNAEIRNK